jgi:arabinan endo-1,5-alpha-L-arabinosidase
MRGTTFVWRSSRRALLALLVALTVAALSPGGASASSNPYDNPLEITIPGDGRVESCADPTVIRSQSPGDPYWYAYCTTDPLNDEDRNASGGFNFHLIPILRSLDLVQWTYVGDAFAARPSWIAPTSGMWAPDIHYANGQYYLYYTAPETVAGGSAIGVATAPTAAGPFTDSGAPVVEPHPPACCPADWRWVFDPDVIEVGGTTYIFYGSYFGGISVRVLTPDLLRSLPASQVQIALPNRYEGAHVVAHGGFFYLFVSATDCCRGPLTGYSVFVGRSASILGPYVDREGASFLEGRIGGTPVISMNGNRWVGTGHNTVFEDFDGQWWTLYHAVDRFDPYFEGAVGFTKRPLLLDPLDWIDGWPTVRGNLWASDDGQRGPAAQPGEKAKYKVPPQKPSPVLGKILPAYSDEFDGATLGPQWSWVRPPEPVNYGLTGTTFRFDTQNADLFESSNNASVLVEDAPDGDYVVESRVHLNLPPEGCCFNYTQAGIVAYRDDDNFIKLVHFSLWETRQTEFAKEWFPVPPGYPRYGNTVVGPPSDWTYLRVARCLEGSEEHYTAYTSRDGSSWVRGGTWTHVLGPTARIGLVSMGGAGFTANFDYVRVYRAKRCSPNDGGDR